MDKLSYWCNRLLSPAEPMTDSCRKDYPELLARKVEETVSEK
jgi:hypothetical protein